MKRGFYICSLFALLSCAVQTLLAQEISDYTMLGPEEFSDLTLPPLDVLFENAKQAPTYELTQVTEQIERKLLSKEKRAFLGFFSLRGSYQYGMFGTSGTYTDINDYQNNYVTSAQNGYTIGVSLNAPLNDIFDLGARVKRQKLSVRSAELQREIKFEEQKKEIIELYATANGQLNVLKLRAEAVILANVQYEIAEKDFANGGITSSYLSVEKERQSQALESFEKNKYELTKSLMILEVVTCTPILRK